MAAVGLVPGEDVLAGLPGFAVGEAGVAAKVTVLARQKASAAMEVRMFMAFSVVGCLWQTPVLHRCEQIAPERLIATLPRD
jgi:hypothetical protein